jgi:hypothetical protein
MFIEFLDVKLWANVCESNQLCQTAARSSRAPLGSYLCCQEGAGLFGRRCNIFASLYGIQSFQKHQLIGTHHVEE